MTQGAKIAFPRREGTEFNTGLQKIEFQNMQQNNTAEFGQVLKQKAFTRTAVKGKNTASKLIRPAVIISNVLVAHIGALFG
jgi:hypothetical protein